MPLPQATFLTEVADSVPGNVRIECGYRGSRDFLQSGLHQAPGKPQSSQTHQEEQNLLGPLWYLASVQDGEDDQLVHRNVNEAKCAESDAPTDAMATSRGLTVISVPTSRLDTSAAALEARLMDTLLSQTAVDRGLEGWQDKSAREADPVAGTSLFILSAMADARRSQPTVSVAPPMSVNRGLRSMALPDELSLPRRLVPALGR